MALCRSTWPSVSTVLSQCLLQQTIFMQTIAFILRIIQNRITFWKKIPSCLRVKSLPVSNSGKVTCGKYFFEAIFFYNYQPTICYDLNFLCRKYFIEMAIIFCNFQLTIDHHNSNVVDISSSSDIILIKWLQQIFCTILVLLVLAAVVICYPRVKLLKLTFHWKMGLFMSW